MTGFDMGSGLFDGMFSVAFILILGVIIVSIVRGISTWNENNDSPRLSVDATVAAKREDTTFHQHAIAADGTGSQGYTTTSSTSYYITFEVESGDRMEFQVDGSEYGMIAERDKGKLKFQGTRYLGFERSVD